MGRAAVVAEAEGEVNLDPLYRLAIVALFALTVVGLRYATGWPWWLCVPTGIVGCASALWFILMLVSRWEDRELKKRGLPLLDDRWPD